MATAVTRPRRESPPQGRYAEPRLDRVGVDTASARAWLVDEASLTAIGGDPRCAPDR